MKTTQEKSPSLFPKMWEISELTSIKRLPARTPLLPYPTETAARRRDWSKSTYVMSLDGEWAVSFHEHAEDVRTSEVADDADDSTWPKVAVPGDLCRQGFSHPHYTNSKIPFGNRPPYVDGDNPGAVMRTFFTLPEGWCDRKTILHIGAAESVSWVYVNGSFAGMSTDSKLPSEFDITQFVRAGVNKLAVFVARWSAGSYLEAQDHWKEMGLHRSVFLYSEGKMFRIDDAAVTAGWDFVKKEGKLHVVAKCRPQVNTGLYLSAKLFDSTGRKLVAGPFVAECPRDFRSGNGETTISVNVPDVIPWSAEEPNLYTMTLTLLDANQVPVDCRALRVGFRDIRVSERKLLVNGKPVLIRGVNRHEFDEHSCKYVPHESDLEDIRLLKRFNFNAVRTCHYPDSSAWLDLCDEAGIYILDEANIEANDNYDELCHDSAYSHAFFERASRMVLRDRNHPCVIGWSLGNESGIGENHIEIADWIRNTDSSRFLHYEGAMHGSWDTGWGLFGTPISHRVSDIICPMYTSVDEIIRYTKEVKDDRPLILCEFVHAMGNSLGGLAAYWKAFETVPGLQGGFIWDWIEQGLLCHDKDGRPYWGYGGDFGDEPNDINFCCNGMINPDRKPKPQMWEFKKLAQPLRFTASSIMSKRAVTVENLDCFRNADWLCGSWIVEINGKAVARGSMAPLEIAPGKKASIALKGFAPDALPRLVKGQEAFLTISAKTCTATQWIPKGYEIAWAQFPVRLPLKTSDKPMRSSKHVIERKSSKNWLVFSTKETALQVSKNGSIIGLMFNDKPVLLSGPEFTLWHAPTDNVYTRMREASERNNFNRAYGRWCKAGLDAVREEILESSAELKDGVVVLHKRCSYSGTNPAIPVIVETQAAFDGALDVSHTITVPDGLTDIPRLSIKYRVPAGFEKLRWFGRGPIEDYPDRCAGVRIGNYESTVTEQFFPFIVPQEHGHHGETRRLSLTGPSGTIISVDSIDGVFGFHATHCPVEIMEKALHLNELVPEPETTLYLDAAVRGLGTGSCGPDAAEEFQIGPGVYRLKYRISAR